MGPSALVAYQVPGPAVLTANCRALRPPATVHPRFLYSLMKILFDAIRALLSSGHILNHTDTKLRLSCLLFFFFLSISNFFLTPFLVSSLSFSQLTCFSFSLLYFHSYSPLFSLSLSFLQLLSFSSLSSPPSFSFSISLSHPLILLFLPPSFVLSITERAQFMILSFF